MRSVPRLRGIRLEFAHVSASRRTEFIASGPPQLQEFLASLSRLLWRGSGIAQRADSACYPLPSSLTLKGTEVRAETAGRARNHDSTCRSHCTMASLTKAIGSSFRNIKREVNLSVLKVPEIEQKTLDATNNEAWGPHGQLLAELARCSFNHGEYILMMNILWKRTQDNGKNWRHVFKALVVLDYLATHGSDRVVQELQERSSVLQSLSEFVFMEAGGRDHGASVRNKAKALLELIQDKSRIDELRQRAATSSNKIQGYSSGSQSKDSRYRDSEPERSGSYGEDLERRKNYYGDDSRGASYSSDSSRKSYGDDRNGVYGDQRGHRDDGDRGHQRNSSRGWDEELNRTGSQGSVRSYGDEGRSGPGRGDGDRYSGGTPDRLSARRDTSSGGDSYGSRDSGVPSRRDDSYGRQDDRDAEKAGRSGSYGSRSGGPPAPYTGVAHAPAPFTGGGPPAPYTGAGRAPYSGGRLRCADSEEFDPRGVPQRGEGSHGKGYRDPPSQGDDFDPRGSVPDNHGSSYGKGYREPPPDVTKDLPPVAFGTPDPSPRDPRPKSAVAPPAPAPAALAVAAPAAAAPAPPAAPVAPAAPVGAAPPAASRSPAASATSGAPAAGPAPAPPAPATQIPAQREVLQAPAAPPTSLFGDDAPFQAFAASLQADLEASAAPQTMPLAPVLPQAGAIPGQAVNPFGHDPFQSSAAPLAFNPQQPSPAAGGQAQPAPGTQPPAANPAASASNALVLFQLPEAQHQLPPPQGFPTQQGYPGMPQAFGQSAPQPYLQQLPQGYPYQQQQQQQQGFGAPQQQQHPQGLPPQQHQQGFHPQQQQHPQSLQPQQQQQGFSAQQQAFPPQQQQQLQGLPPLQHQQQGFAGQQQGFPQQQQQQPQGLSPQEQQQQQQAPYGQQPAPSFPQQGPQAGFPQQPGFPPQQQPQHQQHPGHPQQAAMQQQQFPQSFGPTAVPQPYGMPPPQAGYGAPQYSPQYSSSPASPGPAQGPYPGYQQQPQHPAPYGTPPPSQYGVPSPVAQQPQYPYPGAPAASASPADQPSTIPPVGPFTPQGYVAPWAIPHATTSPTSAGADKQSDPEQPGAGQPVAAPVAPQADGAAPTVPAPASPPAPFSGTAVVAPATPPPAPSTGEAPPYGPADPEPSTSPAVPPPSKSSSDPFGAAKDPFAVSKDSFQASRSAPPPKKESAVFNDVLGSGLIDLNISKPVEDKLGLVGVLPKTKVKSARERKEDAIPKPTLSEQFHSSLTGAGKPMSGPTLASTKGPSVHSSLNNFDAIKSVLTSSYDPPPSQFVAPVAQAASFGPSAAFGSSGFGSMDANPFQAQSSSASGSTQTAYGAPQTGYGAHQTGYGAQGGFGAHPSAYGGTPPSYGAPEPAYGGAPQAYGAQPAFGAQQTAYGMSQPAYGQANPFGPF